MKLSVNSNENQRRRRKRGRESFLLTARPGTHKLRPMPRRLRFASGGYVYHVLNRAVGRVTLFRKDGDYAAFEKTLRQANDFQPMRLLAYCLMPNHWHLLLWPRGDGDLSE